jgi:hypothetical protein
MKNKPYDREEWQAKAKETKELLSDYINKRVATYETDAEALGELVKFSARFHKYSARNTLLICIQNPYASYVASFAAYKKAGYSVNKGETGIKIFVPTPVSLISDAEGNGVKPLSQATEGERKAAAAEGRVTTSMHYKIGNVFDISQTSWPIEKYPALKSLGMASGDFRVAFEAARVVIEADGIKVTNEDFRSITLKGYCDLEGSKIALNNKLGDTSRFSTLIHEYGHAVLHARGAGKSLTSQKKEFEADAFSVLADEAMGFETPESRIRHMHEAYRGILAAQAADEKAASGAEIIESLMGRVTGAFADIHDRLLPAIEAALAEVKDVSKEAAVAKTGKSR